ncbi:Mitogen activated protein kinase kinase kinase-related [Abeliophyllum distichum]|uniref:Mitogen activated protein kinase kinase kinase-related n=1 Tax=Abeliophyllum distichum TaxID=126358 RepID=A0ABD1UI85_9LAMI
MYMEGTRDESRPSTATWWSSDFVEKFGSASLDSIEGVLRNRETSDDNEYNKWSYRAASRTLWMTGMLSEPIPNGFYSVVPDKKLKELFEDIPTLEELHALEFDGLRADVILVDAGKDKKLSMLKQLIVALVKGLNSNPAAVIKKIAGLVSDFYKRPNLEPSPNKAALEDHVSGNRGVQMLGQIKHGSCRPRAILFKVLADTVGLACRLTVGLPTEGSF